MLDHIKAQTYHARAGSLKNTFQYGVDFVMTDLVECPPLVMSRNRFNLWSMWDRNHGGTRESGRGVVWFKETLIARGFSLGGAEFYLLAQPQFLWFQFNPVSFWVAIRDGVPVAIVAEVNNTFGDRHCYFCAHPDFSPILKSDTIIAEKLMHVSPFQKVEGQYHFNFHITEREVDIRINYKNGDQGVLATLVGQRKPATSLSLLKAAISRPFGALRVVALIHWQAVILYFKKAPFLRKPNPPELAVSDSITYRETK